MNSVPPPKITETYLNLLTGMQKSLQGFRPADGLLAGENFLKNSKLILSSPLKAVFCALFLPTAVFYLDV